jgi:putative oxidoreductase
MFIGPCKCAPCLLSVMRIVLGLLFATHGSQKLFGFPPGGMGGGHPVEWISMPGCAGILECFGGALIVLGLFTRPVAFILSGEMAVAYFMVHAKRAMLPIANGGELAVVYCFVFFYLSGSGGGSFSLDRLLQRSKPSEAEPPAAK